MGQWCFRLAVAWLVLVALAAYPCLVFWAATPAREWWWACAIVAFSLVANLRRFAVATQVSPRKILSVEWEILRRMGLVLGLASGLFFLADAGLTEQFWIALAVAYSLALILHTGLLLHQWNAASSPAGPTPPGTA